jgi:hypothetical protein
MIRLCAKDGAMMWYTIQRQVEPAARELVGSHGVEDRDDP